MKFTEAIEIVKEKIIALTKSKYAVFVAIDGGAATGKSTFAQRLSAELDANVFHTDDFFLRPEQKTKERMSEIGGNMDRERFLNEIILPIKSNTDFSYFPYSCKTQSLSEPIFVSFKSVNIIEGAYSHHPDLRENYDLKIFLKAPFGIRCERIKKRSANNAESFFSVWIPMENAYFEKFDIENKSDIIIDF